MEPKEGASVPVLLWDIRPKDELALDHYEGFPNLYGKQMLDVELNGKIVRAMVYVMTPGHEAGYPSEHYLNVIAEGYRSAGFDPGVLADALERTEEIMKQELEAQAERLQQGIRAARAWEGFTRVAAQVQRDGVTRDLRDELDSESLAYLEGLFSETQDNVELEDDAREFLENALKDYPGGMQSIGGEHIEHLLSLYAEYQFGELEWDELEDRCWDYLSGLDDAPEQGNLFGMKWW